MTIQGIFEKKKVHKAEKVQHQKVNFILPRTKLHKKRKFELLQHDMGGGTTFFASHCNIHKNSIGYVTCHKRKEPLDCFCCFLFFVSFSFSIPIQKINK